MRRYPRSIIAAVAAVMTGSALAGQQLQVDTAGVGALLDAGMNRSEAMRNLQYLTDAIGPRLTGSAAARAANEWTMRRFQDYGLAAHLEQWNFGGTWTRGPMWARLVSPRAHDLVAASWAWSPGTGGKALRGPVVRVNAGTPESLAANAARVKGAWVMLAPAAAVWNNDGPPMTAADSQQQRERFRTLFAQRQGLDSAGRARLTQFQNDLPFLLKRMGALGQLTDAGKEQGLLNMSGSPNRIYPLPYLVLAHEDYGMLDRLIAAGTVPQMEASVTNTMTTDSVPQWNTVAEIKGSELPGEVVIVGAHLDSWDLGTGASDNGTGSMATLEAARIIARSGLKPRRTIRFIL
ncbi:MAG TPA: M28 family peptidase, partial [Gemmatimonadales bacterium]